MKLVDQYPQIKISPEIRTLIENLSNNYEIIKTEYLNLLKSPILNLKRTYYWQDSQPEEGWVYSWNDSPDWLNYGLISSYKIISVNRDKCPELMKLLEPFFKKRLIRVAGFSRMLPGCHLKTHFHNNPEKITWHLGITIPDPNKCILTVNGTEYKQEEKQWIRFNDNLNHSSTNFTDKERTILYLKLKEY
jgi:beta-hydroxylase